MEQTLTKEEFHRMMEEERRITFSLLDEQTRKAMTDPAVFLHLLDMLSRGVSTTVSNTILVQAQFPSASAVFSIENWRSRSFEIITDDKGHYPAGIRQFAEDGTYIGRDNKPHTKFKLYKGFDAAQTTEPEAARESTSLIPPARVFIGQNPKDAIVKALITSSPIECLIYNPKKFIDPAEDIAENPGVRYIPETVTVVIRKIYGQSGFPAIAYEVAQGMFHREEGSQYIRQAHGFEAAVISCLLTKRMGLPTDMFKFDLKQLPPSLSPQEFRQRLQKCSNMTQELYHRVTKKLENPTLRMRRDNSSAFLRRDSL